MVKDSHVTPRDEYFTDGGQDCNPEVEESVGNEEKQKKADNEEISCKNGPQDDIQQQDQEVDTQKNSDNIDRTMNSSNIQVLTPDSGEKVWRTKTQFKKWVQDDDRDEIDKILAVKKQGSGEDDSHQFIQNFKKQFTQLVESNPPMPLLPKSVFVRNESPRSGSVQTFLKLTKFRGRDAGKSQFRNEEADVEPVEFNQVPEGTSTSLRHIFQPISQYPQKQDPQATPLNQQPLRRVFTKDFGEKRDQMSAQKDREKLIDKPFISDNSAITTARNVSVQQRLKLTQPGINSPSNELQADVKPENPRMTAVGELVYQRQYLDFKSVSKWQKRDFVLEENLLDVKKLLKTSNFVDKSQQNTGDPEKKALVRVNLEPFYTSQGPDDNTLIFESRFECGNLGAAVKVQDDDYHLLLQNDVNTGGHTQWFFFRVNNVKTGEVRFNMLNLCKPDSLYNQGMKVLVYSERLAAQKDIGWHRGGTKISYYQNQIRKGDSNKPGRLYYTHTFTYDFEHAHDTVYFAYCYPYTYTDMIEDLNKIMQDPAKSTFCKRQTLAETLAGNKCEMMTITAKTNLETLPRRKGIVITARVHPGESNGSWMMKGVLNFLTSTEDPSAELLRQHFVFRIVPMLNPDGVINGNYRCSLAGCDLNRRWKAPSKILHPTIYYTKQMILSFAKERELSFFCDLHGHSRRRNIFMYGCNNPQFPEESRIFPFILGSVCPFFMYNNSRFGNQRSKEATARMALFNDLKNANVFTLEASFQGADQGQFKNYHFSTDNLMQTGSDLCRSILVHHTICCPNPIVDQLILSIHEIYMFNKLTNEGAVERDPDVDLMRLYKEKIDSLTTQGIPINTLQIKKALLKVLRQHQDVQTDGDDDGSAGSDNAPSEDNLKQEEIAEVVPILDENGLKKKKNSHNQQPLVSPYKKRGTLNQKPETAQKLKINPARMPSKGSREKNRREGEPGYEGRSDEERDENLQTKLQIDNDIKTNVVTEENVVHKKKLKKNVESKDACTQTERSDYMLIKQRQKQKEIIQMAKQGNLPPGVTPQQLVNSFMNIQPQANQLSQNQHKHTNLTVPLLPGTKSMSSSAGSVATRAPNSNQMRQQQVSANAYSHPISHPIHQPLNQSQLKSNTSGVSAQRSKLHVNENNDSMLRVQQFIGKQGQNREQAGAHTQHAWANQQRQVTNQSYVVKGSNYNDTKLSQAPINGQLAVENMQRIVGSQHGPRTVSIGAAGPNQPVDGKGSWESVVQQQRVMNGALNQWIQMKHKEHGPPQMPQSQAVKGTLQGLNIQRPEGARVNPAYSAQKAPNLESKAASQQHQSHSNSFLVHPKPIQNQQAYPLTENFPTIQSNSVSKKKKQKGQFKGPNQTLYQHYSDIIGSRGSTNTKIPPNLQVSMLGTSVDGLSKKSLKDPVGQFRGSMESSREMKQTPDIRSSSQIAINSNQPQRRIRQREQAGYPTQQDLEAHRLNINTMSAEFQSQQKLASVLENTFIKQKLEDQSAQQTQIRNIQDGSQQVEETKGPNQIYLYAPPGHPGNPIAPTTTKPTKATPLKVSPRTQKAKMIASQSIDVTKIQNTRNSKNPTNAPQSKSGGPSFKKQRSPLTGKTEGLDESGKLMYGVQLAGMDSESQFQQNQEHFSKMPDTGKNVKINIVNVHNEYNISNNIIIQGQQAESANFSSSQKKTRKQKTEPAEKTAAKQ